MANTINKLLSLPQSEAETKTVTLPRLKLEITLRELDYNTLMDCRGIEDASLHYLLKSTIAPNFRDPAWFREHMGCPTPVDAIKKILRPGEVERLCRVADELNGYGSGSVILDQTAEELEAVATAQAVDELEKNGQSVLTSL